MTKMIQKYLGYLRYEKNYSLHTEISYSKDLKQFQEFLDLNFKNISLKEVEGSIVRQWIAYLISMDMTPRSVNRKLSSLKSFYRYLVRVGEVEVNPLKRLTGPKSEKPLPSFVSDSDMEFILEREEPVNDFETFRDYTIMELLYVTGMRRAELINLKEKDIDLSSDVIRVTGKRNKQRLIPFGKNTRIILEKYIFQKHRHVENASAYLFVKKDGDPLYPMLIYRIVNKYLKEIGTLDKFSPHVLRHSFATGMLNNGAELNAVKEILGHSSLASTEIYAHTTFEELKKTYKKAHPRA